MHVKFLFASNDKPEYSGTTADNRRAIYCEMRPLPKGTEPIPEMEYNRRLFAEGAAFLYECCRVYEGLGPRAMIPVDMATVEEIVASREEKWDVLFNDYFDTAPEGHVPAGHFRKILQEDRKLNDREIGEFKRYLELRHRVERARVETKWIYLGICVKPAVLKNLERLLDVGGSGGQAF
jgi:hypothetical protein